MASFSREMRRTRNNASSRHRWAVMTPSRKRCRLERSKVRKRKERETSAGRAHQKARVDEHWKKKDLTRLPVELAALPGDAGRGSMMRRRHLFLRPGRKRKWTNVPLVLNHISCFRFNSE